jgi:hypothetical protein
MTGSGSGPGSPMKILIDDKIPYDRQFREAKSRASTCNSE